MSNSFLDLNGLAHFKEKMDEQTNKQLANKANIDGYYETLAVGIAKNLEGRNDVTDSFMERTTGGDAEVANGAAQLTEVAGKSQVWNQLIPNISAENINLSGSSYVYDTFGTFPIVNGHKYFINVIATEPTFGLIGFIKRSDYSVNQQFSKVIKGIKTATKSIVNTAIWGSSETTGHCDATINIIDLTLLGIDNLTTVEEVEAWLAENIGLKSYYPYNAGTVLNSKMQGIESLGFNLLDPATSKARIIGAYSDVYGNYYGITGTHGTLTFTSDLGETSEITPDSDGKFLLEEPGWLDVATPGADCAVFLWWDGTQTEYQAYESNTADLDVTHIYGKLNGTGELVQVFPDGIAGIGTAKDVLRIEDGVTVARKRLGKVDLGTLYYSYVSNYNLFRSSVIGVGSIAGVNVISSVYIPSERAESAGQKNGADKTVFMRSDDKLSIKDTQYGENDTAALKASLNGKLLYYPLATEQLYTDLVYQGSSLFADGTPVELPVNYRVNNWGIERMIPQNDSDVVTTFPELTCRYSIDAVEQLNTHTDEIEDLYEGLDELDEKKPNKSGSYPDMAVGSAKAIEGNDTKVEDFTFTPIQCADGLAQIKDVRGKSLVWNQLVQNGNFASDSKWSIVNGTGSISDGVATLTASETNKNQIQQTTGNYFINGHRYYASAIINSGDANVKRLNAGGVVLAQTSGTGKQEIAEIISWSVNSGSYKVGVRDLATENFQQYTVEKIVVIDLTLMFGAGKEPATVEEFEKMFPLPYYAYNVGGIISNKTEEVDSVGFNQWDEEWEVGNIDPITGQNSTSTTKIRSKNYCPMLPNTAYYYGIPNRASGSYMGFVHYYDANKNYISRTAVGPSSLTIVTSDANAHYFRIVLRDEYGTTYNNDICINLSDPSRNGTYEPYKKDTIELNLPTLTGKLNGEGESVVVFPDGLKSVGTVYDEIVGNRAIKRVGVVDLGTLNWSYLSQAAWNCFSTTITGKAKGADNIFPSRYSVAMPYNNDKDKVISGNASNTALYCRDTAYNNDPATFKAAMDGVLLYYELATPEEYILDTPIPDTFQAYKGGTLKQLPENTSTPTTAPMVMENVYAIDVLSVVQSLPKNYISAESLQNLLAAMQSAGIIAGYTMTYNDETQKYQFVITPPSQE